MTEFRTPSSQYKPNNYINFANLSLFFFLFVG
jgi:hypothetical protein